MNRFTIRKLTVSGGGHQDSIIEFTDGLNLIIGPSNTGKSLIMDWCGIKKVDSLFSRIS